MDQRRCARWPASSRDRTPTVATSSRAPPATARDSFRSAVRAIRRCRAARRRRPRRRVRSVRTNCSPCASRTRPIDGRRRRQRRCVRAALLVTSIGVRSLAPGDPSYTGLHRGGPAERDRAYHQGTVWPWLLGPVRRRLPQGRHRRRRRASTASVAHLAEWGLGSVSETADGDVPHRASGCPFQAWSVAEAVASEARARQGRKSTTRNGDKGVCDATGHDRSRPHGRQHGVAAHARRPRMRRLRRQPRRRASNWPSEGAVGGERPRRLRRQARRAAQRVDHGACRVRRLDHRRPCEAARPGRHDHRRRQQLLPRRHPPRRASSPAPASTTSTSARAAACSASTAATA